jgi:hypothetical protein
MSMALTMSADDFVDGCDCFCGLGTFDDCDDSISDGLGNVHRSQLGSSDDCDDSISDGLGSVHRSQLGSSDDCDDSISDGLGSVHRSQLGSSIPSLCDTDMVF